MTDDDLRSVEFHAPAELQQQLPRKISLTSRGIFIILATAIFSTALLAFAGAGFIHFAHEGKNAADLQRDGRLINADEARHEISRGGYIVYYTFTYNGEVYKGEAGVPDSISKGILAKIQESGTLPILYLPESPSINHPADWHESGSLPWFLYILVLLAILLFLSQSYEIRKNWQLARYGEAVVGIVGGYRYARNGTILLKYEFRDSDDLLTEGDGYYPALQHKGARICVLYMPQESGQNRPYPLFFFRAVK
jgi:hypothetical protein